MSRLRSMLRALTNHPKRGVVLAVVALASVLFIFPHAAHASAIGDAIVTILNWILSVVVYILGVLLVKFIDVLIWVFQFNNFINAPAVQIGWSVTRDVANMFFIVALLLIAIGTVFRIQEYRYTRMLQKLIMMAILINFSKLICGFFIDLSQVVMLTFVNAFKDMAAGSLTTGFGLQNVVSLSQSSNAAAGDINYWSIIGAMFAAVVMLFVALIVVGVFVVVLIQRIVMLWIYIVLSPTAYMVAVLPGSLGSWWSSWWRDFSQYLIRGPVIAFFMWLTLTIISLSNQSSQTNLLSTSAPKDSTSTVAPTVAGADLPAFASQATSSNAIISYILAIGMLIAALQQATKVGGAAGAVAGKWMGNLNKWGGAVATSPISMAQGVLKRPAYGTAKAALTAGSYIPGLGNTFGKLNARLERKRQKSEEKDSDWVNYADERTRRGFSTSRFSFTEAGRIDTKNMRENMIKNNQFRGLREGEKDEIIESYRKDIGQKVLRERDPVTGKRTGKFYETATDSPGLKTLSDFLDKKSPATMEADLIRARKHGPTDLATFWEERMKKSLDKMTTQDFNNMDSSDWDVARHPVFNAIAVKQLVDRVSRTPAFRNKMRTDGTADTLRAMNDSYMRVTGSATTLFKRSARIAPGDEEAKRRQERVDQREQSIHSISGLKKFADGKSSQFGMDEALLKNMGYTETAGFVRDPQMIKSIATKMQIKLNKDVTSIEDELADLDIEERSLQKPSTVLDESGRPVMLSETDPQRAAALQAQRSSLESELDVTRRAAARLGDADTMKDLIFYNRDKHPSLGEAKNSIAHENVHKSLQEMDPDGTFRSDLLENYLTPEERYTMAEQMQEKLEVPYLSLNEAFEEYLTEGLVNEGRYGDNGPNPVKLKSGLSLVLREKAEEKNVKLKHTTVSSGEEDKGIIVPEKVSTTGAVVSAGKRLVTDTVKRATKATTGVVSAPFRNVAARVATSRAIAEGESDADRQAALATETERLSSERAALERLEAQQRDQAERELAEQQTYANQAVTSRNPLAAKAAAEKANSIQANIQKRSDAVAAQKKVVADSEARVKTLQTALRGQPATGAVRVPGQPEMMKKEALADTIPEASSRAVAAKATLDQTTAAKNLLKQEIDRDEVINTQQRNAMGTTAFKGTAQQLKSRQQSLAQREQILQAKKTKLAEFEGIIAGQTQAYNAELASVGKAQTGQAAIDRKGEPTVPSEATQVTDIRGGGQGEPVKFAARRGTPSAPTRPGATAPKSETTATAAAAPQQVVEQVTAEAPTIVNNSYTTINNAINSAPNQIRDNLRSTTGFSPKEFDGILRNTAAWRGLVTTMKRNVEELINSEKMQEVGSTDLRKRLGKMDEHFQNKDAPAFTAEYNKFKNLINGVNSGE